MNKTSDKRSEISETFDPPETIDVESDDFDLDDTDTGIEEEIVETRVNDTVIKRSRKKPPPPKSVEETSVSTRKRAPAKATMDELPREYLEQLLAEGKTEIKLEIKRQLPGGKWHQIRTIARVPIDALYELQGPVTALCGGGAYVYAITDPDTRAQLGPRWKEGYVGRAMQPDPGLTLGWDEMKARLVVIPKNADFYGDGVQTPQHATAGAPSVQGALVAGAPRGAPPWAGVGGPQPQYNTQGQLLPPPAALLPRWLHAYSPEHQWEHVHNDRARRITQGGGGPSQSAPLNQWVHHEIRQAGDLKAHNAALEAQIRALTEKVDLARSESADRLALAREETLRAERQAEKAKDDARYEALRAKLDAQATAKPAFDMTALAGLATAIVPLFAAKATAAADQAKGARDAETKLMMAMLAGSNKKESEILPLLTAIVPLAAPALAKMVEGSGAQAQAEVLSIEHEQRMMQLKMFIDMFTAMQPEPPGPMQGLLEGVMGMLGNMRGGLLPGAPRQLPGPQAQPQVPAAPAPKQHPLEALLDQMAESDADAATDVRQVLTQLPVTLGFHTHEWTTILFNLHARLEISEMVEIFVDHAVHCAKYNLLPGPLAGFFTQTREALDLVLGPLPVATKDADYVRMLTDAIVEEVEQRGIVVEEEAPPAVVVDTAAVPS